MAEIWILRIKHEIFSLRLSSLDELQESQWGHVDKHSFKDFFSDFENPVECPFT